MRAYMDLYGINEDIVRDEEGKSTSSKPNCVGYNRRSRKRSLNLYTIPDN